VTDDAKTTKSLAAIVFEDGEDINRIMAEFADDLAGSGLRVAGFVQVVDTGRDGRAEAHVRDLETGARLPIFQNLGPSAQSCRVDPVALVEVARLLSEALARRPNLVVVNRFGRLESEGQGIIDEIAAAATCGIPVLLGVSTRYLEAWRQFAMGFDEQLPCSREALDAWWRKQVAAYACAADP
jgi:nucleoside-triphosphatase THEP1